MYVYSSMRMKFDMLEIATFVIFLLAQTENLEMEDNAIQ